mmetsp:Transcript_17120/g.56006  ORF Transcript_17120/g.56006 Transcript_17120/m.56006 type:complete len:216 (+) Transcript_17120:51-698(+)
MICSPLASLQTATALGAKQPKHPPALPFPPPAPAFCFCLAAAIMRSTLAFITSSSLSSSSSCTPSSSAWAPTSAVPFCSGACACPFVVCAGASAASSAIAAAPTAASSGAAAAAAPSARARWRCLMYSSISRWSAVTVPSLELTTHAVFVPPINSGTYLRSTLCSSSLRAFRPFMLERMWIFFTVSSSTNGLMMRQMAEKAIGALTMNIWLTLSG